MTLLRKKIAVPTGMISDAYQMAISALETFDEPSGPVIRAWVDDLSSLGEKVTAEDYFKDLEAAATE